MTTLQRALGFLNRNGAHYVHTHANECWASEAAAAEHLPHKVSKTVIFWGGGCYAMAVLPADSMIDLKELAAGLGFTSIRLATEAEVAKVFPDCEVSAIPPLRRLSNLPVYLDVSLTYCENIVFHAGSHRDSICMSAGDFISLIDPIITSFARQQTSVS